MTTCDIAVEIRLSGQSRSKKKDVREAAVAILSTRNLFRPGPDNSLLSELAQFDVEHVNLTFLSAEKEASIPYFRSRLSFYIYSVSREQPSDEQVMDESDGTSTKLFMHRQLPCIQFEGVWESLVLEEGQKDKLLRYTDTTLLFSDRKVDPKTVSCNRLFLLHGPAGTGKTSLCQALAQKSAIYHASRYPKGAHLLEVNAHSLFSRWFSESGKLVSRMFSLVRELASDKNRLVFVLVDEVESLTSARGRNSAADPSDAIRVVNSMLTEIDKLRDYPNLLILATSNLTDMIDEAFLDRADVRFYLGPPSVTARRIILKSCLDALIQAGIVQQTDDSNDNQTLHDGTNERTHDTNYWIQMASEASQGMSGRALRKLPMQAHAFYIRDQCTSAETMAKAFYSSIMDIQGQKTIAKNSTT